MDYELSITLIIVTNILGWFWVKAVRDYYQRRRMRLGISEHLEKEISKIPA
jgi:hypothetical protein